MIFQVKLVQVEKKVLIWSIWDWKLFAQFSFIQGNGCLGYEKKQVTVKI